jgi:hypothetical protein
VVLVTAEAPENLRKILSLGNLALKSVKVKLGCSSVVLITAGASKNPQKHALYEILLMGEIQG